MTNKSLNAWLTYLETLHPQTIALGLERVAHVAQKLDLTSFTIPVITIAGTNGKGSCVAFIETILRAAGYRVGAYTSPHLLAFNERIRINAQPVTDENICAAFTAIEQVRDGIPLTYFEFTTLAALKLFKTADLSAIILEVGLGGRLDAVNIVAADLAIITSIALDHMEYLGNDREAIAREKAGIIRAHKPLICGEPAPPKNIAQLARHYHVPLYQVNLDFSYAVTKSTWRWHYRETILADLPMPKLPIANAATALMAIELLQAKLPCSASAIAMGISAAALAGRFQSVFLPQHCILDVAHNPASAALLAQQLKQHPIKGRSLAVVSILGDKDIVGTLEPLLSEIDAWYAGGLNIPRGITANALAAHLQALGVQAYQHFASVEDAFAAALIDCKSDDRIIVFGSFYTVATVLKLLQKSAVFVNQA
jgi:dihydrofolate synthase / folylpolyglutamate synthase